jgi:hypothetical protein
MCDLYNEFQALNKDLNKYPNINEESELRTWETLSNVIFVTELVSFLLQ